MELELITDPYECQMKANELKIRWHYPNTAMIELWEARAKNPLITYFPELRYPRIGKEVKDART